MLKVDRIMLETGGITLEIESNARDRWLNIMDRLHNAKNIWCSATNRWYDAKGRPHNTMILDQRSDI